MVAEVHDERVVAARAGGEPVDTIAELLGRHGQRRWRRRASSRTASTASGRRPTASWAAATTGRRGSERREIGGVGLCRRHIDGEERPPAPRLHDPRRGHHAAEILPSRVGGEDVHVAHDVVAHPGLNALDEVVVTEVAVDDVVLAGGRLDRRTPGQHRVAPAFDAATVDSRIVLCRTLEKAPGCEVELERGRPWLRQVGLLWCDLLEECARCDRRRTARPDVGRASGVARRGRRKIDHADVARDRPHWIVRPLADHGRGVGTALLKRHILRGSGVGDRRGIAQCLLCPGDDRLGVLPHCGP